VFPDKSTTVAGIEILQLRPQLYLMVGPSGSNSVAQIGDQGVLVVDTLTREAGDGLVAAIRSLTGRPILQIVNTSADPDHVGGNEPVRKAGDYFSTANTRDGGGASILAFENTLFRMSADGSPYPKYAWPTDSFFVSLKDLFMNGEPVQVMHQPAAHTDGDAIVHFRKSDVIVAGDVFTPNRYPVIAADQGGTINGVIDGLNRILEIAVPEFNEEGGTLIIPGHGRITDESDVSDYRDMVTIVRDRVRDMVEKRATLDQVKAARLTLDYDGIYASPAYTGDMFVEAIYKTLPPPAPAPAAPARGRR
jgi:glyoxylase-like metal-dependent hydrolase (beta-lactamase superfamily II)